MNPEIDDSPGLEHESNNPIAIDWYSEKVSHKRTKGKSDRPNHATNVCWLVLGVMVLVIMIEVVVIVQLTRSPICSTPYIVSGPTGRFIADGVCY